MFRIRRIFDDTLPVNREAIRQVQQILTERFPLLHRNNIEKIPDVLRDPLKHRFSSILYVTESFKGNVRAFALVSHEPKLRFSYLDYISTAKRQAGGGIGGALYERIREEALAMKAIGLFFECLPDDPKLCKDPEILRQNRARLRFYEKYGARPIANTAYETPVQPGEDNPPYLVFDHLGQGRPLRLREAKAIIRAILELKYGDLCPQDYIEMVVKSCRDDPVRLREPRYTRQETEPAAVPGRNKLHRIALVINDKHSIHHVHERGYVESPVRVRSILRELQKSNLFESIQPHDFSEQYLKTVHDPKYIDYFKRVCKTLEPGKSVYPYVFPIRNSARPPKELAIRAGYYCIDTFTPLNANAYLAAKRGADCALTAVNKILEGYPLAYALVRPPGHHAEKHAFGGFCYFNNGAIAAQYLSRFGKVALLDIDYHHGNGQQQIFYKRSDVLTVSIHGHPRFAYPYFSGFEDETGREPAVDCNINYPLPEHITAEQYLTTLRRALKKIVSFGPLHLIVSLGLDTGKGDPTGTWSLVAADFEAVGKRIGELPFPTLIVQEGGYNNKAIGINARHFFFGLHSARFHR